MNRIKTYMATAALLLGAAAFSVSAPTAQAREYHRGYYGGGGGPPGWRDSGSGCACCSSHQRQHHQALARRAQVPRHGEFLPGYPCRRPA